MLYIFSAGIPLRLDNFSSYWNKDNTAWSYNTREQNYSTD